jgi:hypothetical protein
MDRNDAKQLAACMNGALVAVDALSLLLLSFAASQQAYTTTSNIDHGATVARSPSTSPPAHHSPPHTIKHALGT